MHKTLLSGIAPSGNLHIGNYLGAIRQWVKFQKQYNTYIMVADLHALTTPRDPKALHEKTLEIAALLIACGIDPKQSTLFIQSHVPAHTQLAWILNTITPLGELERMTQFKDKRHATRDTREGTLAGLLNYPVLQAADILLYQTEKVPVGEDQLQHLELARTIARKFNRRFGETFTEPQPIVEKNGARIMGLDDPTKKMSKSATNPSNYIALLDAPDEIRRKIKHAVTDSGSEIVFDKAQKPAISNLITIMASFGDFTYAEIESRYRGVGYADFKRDLAELLVEKLAPIQKKYYEFAANHTRLKKILNAGALRSKRAAEKTLQNAKKKIGLVDY